MSTPEVTQLDREAFFAVARELNAVRAEIAARGDTPSEWQFAERVLPLARVSYYRLARLVALGWAESEPSDGFGKSIRIKPKVQTCHNPRA
jgi:hypothetical protein